MKPEQINKIIAEYCGWTPRQIGFGFRGTTVRTIWYLYDAHGNTIASSDKLPDYFNDLNAMHEAERFYLAQDVERYTSLQRAIIRESDMLNACHATSQQRATAFVKTIGKWQE